MCLLDRAKKAGIIKIQEALHQQSVLTIEQSVLLTARVPSGVDLRLHTGLHFFACILFCHSSVPPHELRVNFGALERRDRILDRLCTVVHVVDADETDRVGMVIDVLGILRRLYGQTLHED